MVDENGSTPDTVERVGARYGMSKQQVDDYLKQVGLIPERAGEG